MEDLYQAAIAKEEGNVQAAQVKLRWQRAGKQVLRQQKRDLAEAYNNMSCVAKAWWHVKQKASTRKVKILAAIRNPRYYVTHLFTGTVEISRTRDCFYIIAIVFLLTAIAILAAERRETVTVCNNAAALMISNETTVAELVTASPETRCPAPSTITDGTYNCTNSDYIGSVCTYSCDDGYDLVGKFRITCVQSVEAVTGIVTYDWDIVRPQDKPARCLNCLKHSNIAFVQNDPFDYLAVKRGWVNVSCTPNNYSVGSRCTITPNEGFMMQGITELTCGRSTNGKHIAKNHRAAQSNEVVITRRQITINGRQIVSHDQPDRIGRQGNVTTTVNNTSVNETTGSVNDMIDMVVSQLGNNTSVNETTGSVNDMLDMVVSQLGNNTSVNETTGSVNDMLDMVVSQLGNTTQSEVDEQRASSVPGRIGWFIDLGSPQAHVMIAGENHSAENFKLKDEIKEEESATTTGNATVPNTTDVTEGTVTVTVINNATEGTGGSPTISPTPATAGMVERTEEEERKMARDDPVQAQPIKAENSSDNNKICDRLHIPYQSLVEFCTGMGAGSVCHIRCSLGWAFKPIHETETSSYTRKPVMWDVRKCDAHGRWSPSRYICSKCPVDDLVRIFSRFEEVKRFLPDKAVCTDSNSVGSVCRLTCKEGYHFLWRSDDVERREQFVEIECTRRAQWSDKLPICAPDGCRTIGKIPNGLLFCDVPERYVEDFVCTYECMEGYFLFGGDKIRRCHKDSKFGFPPISEASNATKFGWQGKVPKCGPACPKIYAPYHGTMQCTIPDGTTSHEFSPETTCTFACDVGYRLVGIEAVMCDSVTFNWNNTDILNEVGGYPTEVMCKKCVERDEEYDHSKVNLTCSPDKTSYGSVCTASCLNSTDWMIPPDGTSQCVVEGKELVWDKLVPICTANPTCRPLMPPIGGYRWCSYTPSDKAKTGQIGTVCYFTCHNLFHRPSYGNGYKVRCVEDGASVKWKVEAEGIDGADVPDLENGSPVEPRCILTCEERIQPDPFYYNQVKCTSANNLNSECTVTCKSGYHRLGPETSKCLTTGWTHEFPKCLGCEPPPQVLGSGIYPPMCDYGEQESSTCFYQCRRRDDVFYVKKSCWAFDNEERPQWYPAGEARCGCRVLQPRHGKMVCSVPCYDGNHWCPVNILNQDYECQITCQLPYRRLFKTVRCNFDDTFLDNRWGGWKKDVENACAEGCGKPEKVDAVNLHCTDNYLWHSQCTLSCGPGSVLFNPAQVPPTITCKWNKEEGVGKWEPEIFSAFCVEQWCFPERPLSPEDYFGNSHIVDRIIPAQADFATVVPVDPADDPCLLLVGQVHPIGTECPYGCAGPGEGPPDKIVCRARPNTYNTETEEHIAADIRGEWTWPVCNNLCPKYPSSGRYTVKCTFQNAIGSECTVTCRPGWVQLGPSVVVCQPDRNWGEQTGCYNSKELAIHPLYDREIFGHGGQRCLFPFRFNGVLYHWCIEIEDHFYLWCSTWNFPYTDQYLPGAWDFCVDDNGTYLTCDNTACGFQL